MFHAEAFAVVALVLFIDLAFGELPNRFHPLRWIGNLLSSIESRTRESAGWKKYALGPVSYFLVVALFLIPCVALTALARHYAGMAGWVVATAVVLKICLAVFSFRVHCEPIAKDLEDGDTVAAAEKTQMIVSRKTEGMGERELASSCVETVSENFADSVVSPGFYFGFLGIIGCVAFRCANLMDAMWGYRDERFGKIGWFPAKLDDVLGYLPSRLSALFVAIGTAFSRGGFRGAVAGAMRWHGSVPSPNSGWPMGAFAGGMGVTMEKKGVYVIGDGQPATVTDIRASYSLLERSSAIFLFAFVAVLFAFVGADVQMWLENAFLGLAGFA
ncbi:MAG: cobalamin biosynthesis protein CobD [Thermoplasmatales archaeon]|mgnify:CR=1 FL=1|nr:cobalamin biosynthesis protein CobD [Thermoplasmatales archaeon]